MSEVFEAPSVFDGQRIGESLFLAGGISNCWDWQSQVIDGLKDIEPLKIFNPRRKVWDSSIDNVEQIKWEFDHLRLCKAVMFWFTKDTVQPITLYELGATLERCRIENETDSLFVPELQLHQGQYVFVGADPSYSRLEDVHVQIHLSGYPFGDNKPPIKFYADLSEMIKGIKAFYEHNKYIRTNLLRCYGLTD